MLIESVGSRGEMPSFLATLSLLTTATFTGLVNNSPASSNTAASQTSFVGGPFSSGPGANSSNARGLPSVRGFSAEETSDELPDAQTCFNRVHEQFAPFQNALFRIMDLIREDENNHVQLIGFIQENGNNLLFKLAAIDYFLLANQDEDKINFIDIVLSSDIDIFVDWYKIILEVSGQSVNPSLASRAKDVLHYYSKGFDKV